MINKKVTKINLGGKERTFYFGLGFLGIFVEKTGVEIDSISEYLNKNPFKAIPEIMFYSLNYGYVRQSVECDFNVYDVSDWIDEAGGVESDVVKTFVDSFTKSMQSGLPEEKGKKKNPTEKK